MRRLGISIYPEHSTPERDRAYMELAARYGFSRIFTCLLSVEGSADQTIERFGAFVRSAHELGFIVAVDTNEDVFARLGATPFDLSPFAQMGVDIIRLDAHFDERGDIMITRNPYNIAVEFNASARLPLALLIERGADPRNISVCHNFYPEPYSGLSEEAFDSFSRSYKALGLHTAAFVSSQQPGAFGPWPVNFGLPTCEDDRTRPIDLQARHILASGLIDDVIVSNCFASEEELAALAAVDTTQVTMRIDLADGVSEAERDVIWGHRHTTRPDASTYLLRSTWPRLAFTDRSIPQRAWGEPVFRRGDVLVPNDTMARYRGQLEVALRDVPNDGTRNLVGRIPAEELFLLDYIAPEHPFGFIRP